MRLETPTFADDPKGALAFYEQFGYVIEPNVWTPSQREKLVRASESLPSFEDATFGPAMNPHNWDETYLEALRNPGIVSIMERLLDGRVSGIQTEFFICKPGTPGFALHQDNYYVEAKPDAFASAWSPMVEVSPANGTLIIYPGTHKEAILPVEPLALDDDPGQDKNARRQQVVVPPQYEPVDVYAGPGDAVIFHGHLVHGSHRNGSDGFRRVLLSTYIRTGETFRPGFYAKRTEVDVYASNLKVAV